MIRIVRGINRAPIMRSRSCLDPHQHLVRPAEKGGRLGYGFGWLTNFQPEESVALHHRAVRDLIRTLGELGEADASRVFLLGFSQSVGVNFRFAFTHPELLRGIVAICGGIPGDWEAEGKYAAAPIDVLYIGAERDEFYPPEVIRQNARALERRARAVETHVCDADHEVPRASYPMIDAWLRERV